MRAVGRPTLHGGPVVLRHVRATPFIFHNVLTYEYVIDVNFILII